MGRGWKRAEADSVPRQSLTRREYFKALKTGCAYEKRQLTSFDGLVGLCEFAMVSFELG